MWTNPQPDRHAVPSYGCSAMIGQLLLGEGFGERSIVLQFCLVNGLVLTSKLLQLHLMLDGVMAAEAVGEVEVNIAHSDAD